MQPTNLILSKDTVHIWHIFFPDFFSLLPQLKNTLKEEEVIRAERYRHSEDRRHFIIARALLRKTLSLYLNSISIEFEYGPHGKPYLKDNMHLLQFNISHSEERALLAISSQAVGIDIEKIRAVFSEKMAKRLYQLDNYIIFDALPSNDKCPFFFQRWADQEAIIKLLGLSLFSRLEINIAFAEAVQKLTIQDQSLYLHQIPLGDRAYKASLATIDLTKAICHFEWISDGFCIKGVSKE